MSKHTPGPWKQGIVKNHGNSGWTKIIDGNNVFIAKIQSIHKQGQRQADDFSIEEANARLIAAAPELLDACIGLIGILTPKQYSKQFPNVYKKAKQAIAKAESEE